MMKNARDNTSLTRRAALAGGLSVPLSLMLANPVYARLSEARPAQTLILDPNTKKWVHLTPRRARALLKARGFVPEQFQRQLVRYSADTPVGSIVVDANQKFLYFIHEPGIAIRYGIGVGRDGFGWAGIVDVGRKAEWPRWTPPADMVKRDPFAAQWAGGMPGGPDNPLGARAIYLYENGRDTIYRIHGTREPWSIGLNLSSGCIRMLNEDVIDLYNRTHLGAEVTVLLQNPTEFEGVKL